MRVLVFDTETTGLPPMTPNRKFINPEEFRYYDGCRIIEIAYKIFDHETKTELVSFKSLVYHEGVDIKNSHIHGITNEMVKSADAISIHEMLTGLLGDLERHKVQRFVAHNQDFDFKKYALSSYENSVDHNSLDSNAIDNYAFHVDCNKLVIFYKTN